ncbi:palindromic element RPE3 domain-containing protein [Rickettsia endosymbiont of Halotydeus destructor]
MYSKYLRLQLNSERFRQDEFNGEPVQRTKVREHRRIQKNSFVSSFLNDAVQAARCFRHNKFINF